MAGARAATDLAAARACRSLAEHPGQHRSVGGGHRDRIAARRRLVRNRRRGRRGIRFDPLRLRSDRRSTRSGSASRPQSAARARIGGNTLVDHDRRADRVRAARVSGHAARLVRRVGRSVGRAAGARHRPRDRDDARPRGLGVGGRRRAQALAARRGRWRLDRAARRARRWASRARIDRDRRRERSRHARFELAGRVLDHTTVVPHDQRSKRAVGRISIRDSPRSGAWPRANRDRRRRASANHEPST